MPGIQDAPVEIILQIAQLFHDRNGPLGRPRPPEPPSRHAYFLRSTSRLARTCKRLNHLLSPLIWEYDAQHCESWAIVYGATAGRADIVRKSLAHGGDIKARSGRCLHEAIARGHAVVVRLLLDRGADPNSTARYQCQCATTLYTNDKALSTNAAAAALGQRWTALHLAVCRNRTEIAKELILRGASLTDHSWRLHVLHDIARFDNAELFDFVVDGDNDFRPATVDMPDWHGSTPLHWAVKCLAKGGSDEIVLRLLRHGADPSWRNRLDMQMPWLGDRDIRDFGPFYHLFHGFAAAFLAETAPRRGPLSASYAALGDDPVTIHEFLRDNFSDYRAIDSLAQSVLSTFDNAEELLDALAAECIKSCLLSPPHHFRRREHLQPWIHLHQLLKTDGADISADALVDVIATGLHQKATSGRGSSGWLYHDAGTLLGLLRQLDDPAVYPTPEVLVTMMQRGMPRVSALGMHCLAADGGLATWADAAGCGMLHHAAALEPAAEARSDPSSFSEEFFLGLMDAASDVNAPDCYGFTPLALAATFRRTARAAALLMEGGASPAPQPVLARGVRYHLKIIAGAGLEGELDEGQSPDAYLRECLADLPFRMRALEDLVADRHAYPAWSITADEVDKAWRVEAARRGGLERLARNRTEAT